MKKRKLKPWVKVAMAFMVGVIVVSQIFNVIDSKASTEEVVPTGVLHGVVEYVGDYAVLTMIEQDLGFASVKVKNDSYVNGDIVTVIFGKDGDILNSYHSPKEEIEEVRNNHGATYRMLLEKHDKYFPK